MLKGDFFYSDHSVYAVYISREFGFDVGAFFEDLLSSWCWVVRFCNRWHGVEIVAGCWGNYRPLTCEGLLFKFHYRRDDWRTRDGRKEESSWVRHWKDVFILRGGVVSSRASVWSQSTNMLLPWHLLSL